MRLSSYPGFQLRLYEIWASWRHNARWHKMQDEASYGKDAMTSMAELTGAWHAWQKLLRRRSVDRHNTEAGSSKARRRSRKPHAAPSTRPKGSSHGEALEEWVARRLTRRCWKVWSAAGEQRRSCSPGWSGEEQLTLHQMDDARQSHEEGSDAGPGSVTALELLQQGLSRYERPSSLTFGAYHTESHSNDLSPINLCFEPILSRRSTNHTRPAGLLDSAPSALLTAVWNQMSVNERSLAMSKEIQRASWILLCGRVDFVTSVRELRYHVRHLSHLRASTWGGTTIQRRVGAAPCGLCEGCEPGAPVARSCRAGA